MKRSTRRTRDGQVIGYLQLAHNEWDPVSKSSKTRVLHNFRREDQVDLEAVRRLVASLSKLLTPGQALAAGAPAELAFTASVAFGGTHALDGIWSELGIAAQLRTLGAKRRFDARFERILFALVANRALAPSSKLAAADWISHDVHIAGLDEVGEDACYRAMDWLPAIEPVLAREVYFSVAHLLNLEVDLLFFDTTSTYFETGQADEAVSRDQHGRRVEPDAPAAAGEAGFRAFGKSKDHRDDLPQVIVGMAVTRDGIPVRCWSWPGNTADSALIRQVRDQLREWNLARIVWVGDRGFASEANRRYLQQGGGHYILGEKLRGGTAAADTALSRQGRYQKVRDNLEVKEVRLDPDLADDRFVICFNPDEAERDRVTRERHVSTLTELITDSDKLSKTKRGELRGVISTKKHLNRYLRLTAGGLLRVDQAAIKREANLDGKYLLRCSDPKLSAEDIALGYKQLLEVERGWRDMKTVLDLRPVYHRREDRIRAHVLLCWLGLLLIRVAENRTGRRWPDLRRDLDRIHLGTFTGPAGVFRRRTDLTPTQTALFTALGINPPPLVIEAAPG
uniref:IS1634 family transposase n=1 Tax=Saccharopolyspora pogona TaxID=333966 RepID=UPI001688F064|nr:IS1634 family transposase [Saccharopolyspora pogona]